MKQNDIGTRLNFTILDQDDEPVILSSAEETTLVISLNDEIIERDCEVTSALEGKVRYTTVDGDFTDYGTAKFEVRVEFNDGRIFTSSRIKQEIKPRLGD